MARQWESFAFFAKLSSDSKKQRTLLKVHLRGLPKEMERILMCFTVGFSYFSIWEIDIRIFASTK